MYPMCVYVVVLEIQPKYVNHNLKFIEPRKLSRISKTTRAQMLVYFRTSCRFGISVLIRKGWPGMRGTFDFREKNPTNINSKEYKNNLNAWRKQVSDFVNSEFVNSEFVNSQFVNSQSLLAYNCIRRYPCWGEAFGLVSRPTPKLHVRGGVAGCFFAFRDFSRIEDILQIEWSTMVNMSHHYWFFTVQVAILRS